MRTRINKNKGTCCVSRRGRAKSTRLICCNKEIASVNKKSRKVDGYIDVDAFTGGGDKKSGKMKKKKAQKSETKNKNKRK